MHPATAMTIAVRHAAADLINESKVVHLHIEQTIGTYLSKSQVDQLLAATDVLNLEIAPTTATDAELREAHRILTDNAYAAQEAIEVDAL